MVVEDLLRQLPESVSKTIHQTTTPHGTIFQSLMLVAALLMLASEFPKFDFVQPNYDVVLIGFEFCRYIFPAVGIVMLVFIPMSHDYILMIDRFKRPGYQLTQEDRAVFYANKLQEDMHQFAGMLVFAATPALEGRQSPKHRCLACCSLEAAPRTQLTNIYDCTDIIDVSSVRQLRCTQCERRWKQDYPDMSLSAPDLISGRASVPKASRALSIGTVSDVIYNGRVMVCDAVKNIMVLSMMR